MEEKAKERVFGVVILVALAVIFVPMWFNTTVGDSVKLAKTMPQAPEWPQSEELLLPTAQLSSSPMVPEEILSEEPAVMAEAPLPVVAAVPVVATAPLIIAPAPVVATVPVIAKAPKITLPAKGTSSVRTKPLMAYTIQLGNFENQANAKKLAQSLRGAGYTAYVSNHYSKGKDLTKVMVGPQVDRQDAEKIALKLENQFKLKGFVVKYDPRN